MAIQMTIIGLGQIGASMGLALAKHRDLVLRVGHDKDSGIARKAQKAGALDKVELNLHNAVEGADLVLLSLPVDCIRETLEQISEDLKEGAVVMDTGPAKEVVAAWAGELFKADRYYIGLTPVINPDYLVESGSGLDLARADLFNKGLVAISAPPRTNSEAIKLAADLARLLGSTPLFADPLEMDGLMAATHILPQLTAAALLNATLDQPGWREGRKIAGRSYAEATAPLINHGDPKTLSAAALLNRENVLRMMDSAIAALQAIRADIAGQDNSALEERLTRAQQGGERWWQQRQAGEWSGGDGVPAQEIPTASEVFGRLIGFTKKKK